MLLPPLVLYHANCQDGFVAALFFYRKFDKSVECVPVNYGSDPPWNLLSIDRPVFIVDFSYPPDVIREICRQSKYVTMIDHHKTAAEAWDITATCWTTIKRENLEFHFCNDHSGAMMSFMYLYGDDTPRPGLACHVEDRDLWRWSLPYGREINAYLSSLERNFDGWFDLAVPKYASANSPSVVQGTAILRFQDQLVKAMVASAREINLGGYDIRAANAPVLHSEVAGQLAVGRPFGAAFMIDMDGNTYWSLRSTPDGIDVSEVAKKNGGGGHKHAAGFKVS